MRATKRREDHPGTAREGVLSIESARNAAVDVLRGLAVLAVMLLHLNIRVPFSRCAFGRSLPSALYALIFWSGYPAVIVFFVVSGFLITSTTEKRYGLLQRIDVKSFYRRRFARIAPALVLFVVVQSLLQTAHVTGFSDPHPSASLPTTLFSVLTFRLNGLEARVGYLPGAWDVLWSLCVEELFYLGFPVVSRMARAPAVLYSALLAFVLVGPFARVSFSSNPIWMDHSYLSCMGEIAMGCLAALFVKRCLPSHRASVMALVTGVGLMSLVLFFRRAAEILGLYALGIDVTVLAFGTAALLVAFTALPSCGRLASATALRPLRWLGQVSYEVYLCHLFIVIPATLLFNRRHSPEGLIPLLYAVVLVSSALLGSAVAKAYSEPVRAKLRG